MRKSYYKGNYRSSKPGFPRKNRKQINIEADLIRSIEYSKQNIQTNEVVYVAKNTFEDFKLNYQLLKNIKTKGYVTPSQIQDTAIPSVMLGKDLIGIANTGTGKTAAFLVPLIEKVAKDKTQKVLIITPTRELAEQIDLEFRSLSNNMGIYSAIIIGGRNIRKQINDLKYNPNFVIGTPGRIKDLIQRKLLVLSGFNNVVLDETDRMVDIGFVREIQMFISLLPKDRQSLFFSATISRKVEDILQAFVKDAVTVSAKKTDVCKTIKQDYIRLTKSQTKVEYLHELLIKKEFEKVIVFGNTKWKVQRLSEELVTRGFRAEAIHGNKKQSQRSSIIRRFKNGEVTVLLATDVASRGLDINGVSHVINYELPETYDDYVHRIGRTGRANKEGIALTLLDPIQ